MTGRAPSDVRPVGHVASLHDVAFALGAGFMVGEHELESVLDVGLDGLAVHGKRLATEDACDGQRPRHDRQVRIAGMRV
jgi:hypothetical protein